MAGRYLHLRRPDKAIAWLNEVLAINSSVLGAYAAHGVAFEMQGKAIEAQADFDRVLQAAPQDRFNVAQMYLTLEQPDKAIALLNQFLAANDKLVQVYDVRGAAYEMKGEFALAKADYEHVLTLAPKSPGIREKLKRADEALAKPKK